MATILNEKLLQNSRKIVSYIYYHRQQMGRKIIYIDNFLKAHGHTPVTGEAMVNLFTNEGWDIVYASSIKNKVSRLYDMLKTIFINRKKSIVLIAVYSTDAFYFAWLCGLLCYRLKITYIPCLHGGNLPERLKSSGSMSKQLFGRSFTNVAVSGYLEQSIKKHDWPCVIIPNYINIEAYPFLQRQVCKPKLLWVRSFHEIYQPQLAIRVLYELIKTYPNVSLTMVGPDKDGSMELCRQLALNLKVDDHIKFTGLLSRDEWIAISAEYDIFINTSKFDNLPVSIIEAMALGLIVVSTNVGGVPFLITNSVNGLLVSSDNAVEMATAIKNIVENNAYSKQLAEMARNTATLFDYRNIVVKWNKLLG